MNKKLILGIVVVALIAIGGWFFYGSWRPTAEGNIKIGFIGPLTGDAAVVGEPIKNAVVIAVDEINAAGGINGRQIEIIYEDGKCNGKDAVAAAGKLINIDKVKIIIGGLCSGETLAVAPLAERSKIILFSPASSNPDITNAGDYIFRNYPSDASTGRKMAEVAMERGWKKLAILTENTEYVQGVRKVLVNRLTELGGIVVSDEKFTTEGAKDLRTQIAKARQSKADAIYFATQTPQNALLVLKQLNEQGYHGQILANEMIGTDIVLKAVPRLIEGALYAEAKFDPQAPLSKKFLDKYIAKHGGLPSGAPPAYIAAAYDAPYILKEQLDHYGENTEKIKRGLYGIKNRPSAEGLLSIDENGDAVLEYIVKAIQNGKPVTVSQ